jgi:hypothetical protein
MKPGTPGPDTPGKLDGHGKDNPGLIYPREFENYRTVVSSCRVIPEKREHGFLGTVWKIRLKR